MRGILPAGLAARLCVGAPSAGLKIETPSKHDIASDQSEEYSPNEASTEAKIFRYSVMTI